MRLVFVELLVWVELVPELVPVELEERLSVLDPVEALVWVVEVALDDSEVELELLPELEVWVIVGPTLSAGGEPGRAGPPVGVTPTAIGSWLVNPTAVMPLPANAESAARRAQRRWHLIGILCGSSSSSCRYRRAAHAALTLSFAGPPR